MGQNKNSKLNPADYIFLALVVAFLGYTGYDSYQIQRNRDEKIGQYLQTIQDTRTSIKTKAKILYSRINSDNEETKSLIYFLDAEEGQKAGKITARGEAYAPQKGAFYLTINQDTLKLRYFPPAKSKEQPFQVTDKGMDGIPIGDITPFSTGKRCTLEAELNKTCMHELGFNTEYLRHLQELNRRMEQRFIEQTY